MRAMTARANAPVTPRRLAEYVRLLASIFAKS
jgi:hypothetical protein